MKSCILRVMSLGLFLIIGGLLQARLITVEGGRFEREPDTLIVIRLPEENKQILRPRTTVELSSFQIWQTEVTRAQYDEVMGIAPDILDNTNLPMHSISWFDAIEFCNRKSIIEGLTPVYRYIGYRTNPDTWPVGWNTDDRNHANIVCDWTADGYRLPTEMEWMYAARGGIHNETFQYSGSDDINAVAWFGGNSHNTAREVEQKQSNALDLYDMSGNVWEWCWDIHRSYETGDLVNPRGPETGSYRVLRGGSWISPSVMCSVSHRFSFAPTTRKNYIGFRIARTMIRN